MFASTFRLPQAAPIAAVTFVLAASPGPRVLLAPVGVNARRPTEILTFEDEDVVAAIRFIRENAHRPLRVADVLQHVPLARRTLERRCRGLLGRGVIAEIRRTRIDCARRLLVGTELTIQAVARQAGYSDTVNALQRLKELRATADF